MSWNAILSGFVLAALLLPAPALAQIDDNPFLPGGGGMPGDLASERLQLLAELAPLKVARGGKVTFTLTLLPRSGFHTYPAIQKDPQAESFVTEIEVKGPARTVGLPEQSAPEYKDEPGIGTVGMYEHRGTIAWTLQVDEAAPLGPTKLTVTVNTQVCDKSCVPVNKKFDFEVTIEEGTPGTPTDSPAVPPSASSPRPAERPAETSVDAKQLRSEYEAIVTRLLEVNSGRGAADDLWSFLAAGAIIGLISVFTPCVFPMIPITVSIFLKKSEEEHHSPLITALVYCGTIVVVLTLSAIFLLSIMQSLSQNPAMNFAIGGLFIYFALSLLGLYEIELPSFIGRYTSAREGAGGQVGTIFSALTFTIISFSCVAPFLGGFAGTATQARPWTHIVFGGLAFATAFASPFFLLAFFPSMLRRLRSGSWLNSVKVVMGFLELAAAFKFLRAAELGLRQGAPAELLTYDLVLAVWVAICLAIGIYLLGLFRTAHDSEVERVGVGRLLFALFFVGLGLHLAPALWRDGESRVRPSGAVFAWIDSFLLDEPSPAEKGWTSNLDQALRRAEEHRRRTRERRLVFIDFTGIQCVNCRINEASVFPRPEVKEQLERYELVKLYTDTREPVGDTNKWFQESAFGTLELPLYVIIEPLESGRIQVHGSVGGKIQSVDNFVQFLKAPLEPRPVASR